jgi:tRNA (guanine-N7-)-methyltransferase
MGNMYRNSIHTRLRSFGRIHGRSLGPYQQRLVDELLPQLQPDLGALTPPVALEIGFGAGEHLAAQALHNPEKLYVGCEPYINGVAKLLSVIDRQAIRNIRIDARDVRELLTQLPERSVQEVFILFPDPWPKTKQKKRRLVNAETLEMLARVHVSGGRLLLATDHEDYACHMLELLLQNPYYRWLARKSADWHTPPSDWTVTKYQRKTSAEGRPPMFFECVRA